MLRQSGKNVVLSPNCLRRLDHATLKNIFPELVGYLFVQVEAALGPGKPPSPQRLWSVGMAEGSLPASLTAASRAGSTVCPQALQVPVEESREARADSFCQAWLAIPLLPSLSLLWAEAVWHFMPQMQLQETEVGKEGKNRLILCSTVTVISQA